MAVRLQRVLLVTNGPGVQTDAFGFGHIRPDLTSTILRPASTAYQTVPICLEHLSSGQSQPCRTKYTVRLIFTFTIYYVRTMYTVGYCFSS